MGSNESQTFRADGKVLRFQSGATTDFEHPIGETIDFGDVIVVRLEAPHESQPYNENVFGVAKDGKVL